MKLSSLIAARPVSFFIFLAFVVLLLPALVIPCWHRTTRHIERDVKLNNRRLQSRLQSEIESVGKLLSPLNSSTSRLAKLVSLIVNGSELFSSEIESKVSPMLFQAFTTIPLVSQISYIGLNGGFFSYYMEGNQVLALHSNSSNIGGRMEDVWYKQPVDPLIGKLYGGPVAFQVPFSVVNTSWFQASLNSMDVYASLGDGWGTGDNGSLILHSIGIHGRAVISLGFPVKALIDIMEGIELYGGNLYLATEDGEMLMEGIPDTHMTFANSSISFQAENANDHGIAQIGTFRCIPRNATECTGILAIGEAKFKVFCSQIEILGVQLVYALLMPYEGSVNLVKENNRLALILLAIMVAVVIISVLSFVLLMVRAGRREMHLCAKLIKQMEATQQAERKSMNKSLAFASASHDIRTPLAAITELIRISKDEVLPGSDLESNLKDMESCTKDLLGLLNSILDMSKIEAGKMQLEEEEFNLAELLEQVADFFHIMGMKKGVDVVLDPHDGSILKFSHVRGDRGRLKQVLCNLISNAVKFTFEGHVTIRAWVQKLSLQSDILASSHSGLNKCLTTNMFCRNRETCNDMAAIVAVRQNPNSLAFVFEVDDTGKGIPKEKRKSVFENFVQAKETALRKDQTKTTIGRDEEETALSGTGLGLGIVQSLVRLMGGEIGIVDKPVDEKGTCFRFNVFLTVSDMVGTDNTRGENEGREDHTGADVVQRLGQTISTLNPCPSIQNPSPRLGILSSSPRLEGSQVVLLIQNIGRRASLQKYMESLGINILVVERWDQLSSVLEKMKSKQITSPHNSTKRLEGSSRSDMSSASSKDFPLSAMDGTEQKLQLSRKRGFPWFILLVIDAGAGPVAKLDEIVSKFRRSLQSTCKVVWLDNSVPRKINSKEKISEADDDILVKPFHGSRLYQVIKLLPEFGGNLKSKSIYQAEKVSQDCASSSTKPRLENQILQEHPLQQREIQEETSPRNGRLGSFPPSRYPTSRRNLRSSPPHSQYQPRQIERQAKCADSSKKQLWTGKRILVAEDNKTLRKVTMKKLEQDGAIVEVCENGEEALKLVRNGLRDRTENGASHVLPYDYILMDCQMPLMDGYEAARRIREEEKVFGVHLPIFALTGHVPGEETRKAITAGMDDCLGKPLQQEALTKAIRKIHGELDIV
ncbi:hypothetical protein SLE2022_331790 [Rubroshorea leprosula]